ncbi:MAG: ABC transporter permease [Spirochaetes bacterium]|nr:ABC transporter permease [Spirochaetota bacterium]
MNTMQNIKTIILISWRNVFRNKRRSAIVASSIVVGLVVMMFSMAIMNGFNRQMLENTINTSLGHVAVHKKGFFNDMNLLLSFVPDGTIGKINTIPGVRCTALRVKFEAMVQSSRSSQGVLVLGIEPEKEKCVSNIYEYAGKNLSNYIGDSSTNEILISRSLAQKLGLNVGDKCVLMLQDKSGVLAGHAFIVKGLFQSPIESFDKYVVYIGIRTAQIITGLGNAVSEITVRCTDKEYAQSVAYALHAPRNDSLEVLTWKQMAPNIVRAIKLFDTMMYVFLAIIFISIIFTIANTMIMAIMERYREIGIMKSIGTSPLWVASFVIFEACCIGAIGICAGLLITLLLVGLTGTTGLNFAFYSQSMRVWGTGTVIYPFITMTNVVVATIIVFGNTILASVYPAYKAANIKPIDALHFM